MLSLTHQPIDTESLNKEMANPRAGALVTFEGWVRRENLNREVTHLEYEAAEELAVNEFNKIAEEARAQFDILDLRCVHRAGRLEIGDVAVWIGVIAEHRGDAFDACRFIIDTLKQRLPIWKKESYTDTDSGWINSP